MDYFGILELELLVECEHRSVVELVPACSMFGLRFDLIFFEGVVGGDDELLENAREGKRFFVLVGHFDGGYLDCEIIH